MRHSRFSARARAAVIKKSSIMEQAFGHCTDLLKPVLDQLRLPDQPTRDTLRRQLATAYDHQWFRYVANICARLDGLEAAFGARLYQLQQRHQGRRLEALFGTLQQGEGGFEEVI